ncbi:MAG TPA: hypothetical protein PL078_04750 [Bacillota bacterium]|jgi:hypothetical protein|nr:hypothetical protein [Peptococcaceae bacterium MAG4]NLW37883.1 hypothetical protein [Peptococcaceae bacterium]HPZ43296.1 hypothetical protein [Bacillota bacterium]HQD75167.1 hypothetical protein [Bacillota bacterium]HUM57869.1 hypothetical protein [Bacillota bacterium]
MLNYRDILDTLQSKGYLATFYDHAFDDKYPSYFFNPNSIHGVLHAKRVLLLSLALSYLNGLNKTDTGILAKASLYHDIGRTHDGVCSEHGRKSFQKAIGLGLIEGEVNENNEVLRYVIVNHCLDDNLAESLDGYLIDNRERAVRLLKLFKDSDGLDRVRINDLDAEYLRYPVSRKLVSFAEHLLREIR